MKTFVYTGPSWGELSYDPIPDFDVWPNYTNLALEWNLHCENTAKRGNSNIHCIDSVRHYGGPVVWVMCEPLVELLHNVTADEGIALRKHYLLTDDHLSFRQALKIRQLNKINNLGRPIGIVGAHSDIRESDVKDFHNLKIIEPSWQNFIADLAGIPRREYNWGYEIAHVIMKMHPDVKPSDQLVNDMYEGFSFWKLLEDKKLFWEVHPSRTATELFAKHTKEALVNFLNKSY